MSDARTLPSDERCAICTKTRDEHVSITTHKFKDDPRPSNENAHALAKQIYLGLDPRYPDRWYDHIVSVLTPTSNETPAPTSNSLGMTRSDIAQFVADCRILIAHSQTLYEVRDALSKAVVLIESNALETCEPLRPPQRYRVQQDKGEYALKGCTDGDLVDYNAYEALLRRFNQPHELKALLVGGDKS